MLYIVSYAALNDPFQVHQLVRKLVLGYLLVGKPHLRVYELLQAFTHRLFLGFSKK